MIFAIIPRRKKQIMSKKKEVELEDVDGNKIETPICVNLEVKKPVYDSLALGFAKSDHDGNWYLVRIPYNLNTNEVGSIEKSREGDMKAIAIERFQIAAANELMVEK